MNIIFHLVGILFVNKCAGDFRNHPNWPRDADEICGETNSDRIIGGQTAAIGQFPWMAKLVFRNLGELYATNIHEFYIWSSEFCPQIIIKREVFVEAV